MTLESAAPGPAPIIVGIVDDKRSLRDGLAVLINGTPGFRCPGTWGSVEAALRDLPGDGVDVLLLDIGLPGTSGIDGVALFKQRFPRMQVLMLTVFEEREKVFESICNGASGYLLKNTPPGNLLTFIREARDGGAPLSPAIARKVIGMLQAIGGPERLEHDLSPQQLRLLALLADGHTYQTAADAMGISLNTVRDYVGKIYERLHVNSKTAAVRKAIRGGLLG
jgi:DNA-binding NarL/FixJ family response regulator